MVCVHSSNYQLVNHQKHVSQTTWRHSQPSMQSPLATISFASCDSIAAYFFNGQVTTATATHRIAFLQAPRGRPDRRCSTSRRNTIVGLATAWSRLPMLATSFAPTDVGSVFMVLLFTGTFGSFGQWVHIMGDTSARLADRTTHRLQIRMGHQRPTAQSAHR